MYKLSQERVEDVVKAKKYEVREDPHLLTLIGKVESALPVILKREVDQMLSQEEQTIESLCGVLAGLWKFEHEIEMDVQDLIAEHTHTAEESKDEGATSGTKAPSIDSKVLKQRILSLEETLSRQIIGQPQAIKAVYEAALCRLAGLSRPSQPMGRFLFVGPTGVGKTELAKTLSRELFDNVPVLTINMPEYADRTGVHRLIGSPFGYADSDKGGLLTNFVHTHPFSVILVDEAEKGSNEVMDLFLKILDEGVLHDPQDRKIDFKNTFIIFTSNLGAAENNVNQVVRRHFRPEFLGRLDQIVTFNPLSQEMHNAIIDLELEKLKARIAGSGNQVEFSVSLYHFLYKKSWDDRNGFGTRGIQKMISDCIFIPLAKQIIASEGCEKYHLHVIDEKLEILHQV